MQRHFARFGLALADYGPLFEHLDAEHHNKERVKIPLAPANLHWCSDAALEILADYSARYVGADAHAPRPLVETAYQKEYARRRGGGTALDYIDRFPRQGWDQRRPRHAAGDAHGVAYSSIARLQGVACFGVPKIRALLEDTYFIGLRKPGVPEE